MSADPSGDNTLPGSSVLADDMKVGTRAAPEDAKGGSAATDRPAGIDKSMLALPMPRRYRNRKHLRYVARQPCLLCGRKEELRTIPGNFTPINPSGFGSNWCGSAFIVAGKFDLTAMANLK